jgi:DNA replication protein DnaC
LLHFLERAYHWNGAPQSGQFGVPDAMMDRLIHTAHKLDLKGPSMREYLAKL